MSQSATTGRPTARLMWAAASSVSVIVRRLTSGIARWAAETVKLEDQTTGKPAASISLALSASWAPTAGTRPGRARSSRRIRALLT